MHSFRKMPEIQWFAHFAIGGWYNSIFQVFYNYGCLICSIYIYIHTDMYRLYKWVEQPPRKMFSIRHPFVLFMKFIVRPTRNGFCPFHSRFCPPGRKGGPPYLFFDTSWDNLEYVSSHCDCHLVWMRTTRIVGGTFFLQPHPYKSPVLKARPFQTTGRDRLFIGSLNSKLTQDGEWQLSRGLLASRCSCHQRSRRWALQVPCPPFPLALVGYLEDHPRTCKWLGSPPFISVEKAIWKGNNPILWGLTITMVINHLLNGMILQVGQWLVVKGTILQEFLRFGWFLLASP